MLGKDYLNWTEKSLIIKEKNDKLDYIKINVHQNTPFEKLKVSHGVGYLLATKN